MLVDVSCKMHCVSFYISLILVKMLYFKSQKTNVFLGREDNFVFLFGIKAYQPN